MHPFTAYALPRSASRESHANQFANPGKERMETELKRLSMLTRMEFVAEMRDSYPSDERLFRVTYPALYRMVSKRGLRKEIFPEPKPQGHAWRSRHPLGEAHKH